MKKRPSLLIYAESIQFYAVHIGLDWAGTGHAIALQEAADYKIEERWLSSDPESVHTWDRSLGGRFEVEKVAVGIELTSPVRR
jgi:hypothetical protein